MIKQIEQLPENVIGFTFTGKVTGNDYEKTIFPVLKKVRKQKKKIRIICEFEKNFNGLNLKAMLDDATIGFKYFFNWERIAIVSDHDSLNHFIKAFSFLIPGHMKIFLLSKKAEAIEWISKTDSGK